MDPMVQSPTHAPQYPVVQLLVTRGKLLSAVLCAVITGGILVAGFFTGIAWLYPLALIAGVVLMTLLASYIEILRIIADTLLPKY